MTDRMAARLARPLLAFVLAVASLTGSGPLTSPDAAVAAQGPTSATVDPLPASPSADVVEGYLRTWLNADRAANGLQPLRLDIRLRTVARDRASTLAVLNVLDHAAAGDLGTQLTNADVRDFGWGEDIGWTSYAWGQAAASSLYAMWKHSSEHWSLMMNPDFNYVGVGLAHRAAGNATYASIVFTESPDHTAPVARLTSASRSGATARFAWTGTDVLLQTHTAGLASFDVEYKIGGGSWRTIRTGTHATSLSLKSRPHGHSYWLSVRARDRAGNLSAWSKPLHVWVP